LEHRKSDRNIGGVLGVTKSISDETAGVDQASEHENLSRAHPHHKDKGTVVHTAFDEPMSGGIADIADGDA
jgi:hypothetical protein